MSQEPESPGQAAKRARLAQAAAKAKTKQQPDTNRLKRDIADAEEDAQARKRAMDSGKLGPNTYKYQMSMLRENRLRTKAQRDTLAEAREESFEQREAKAKPKSKLSPREQRGMRLENFLRRTVGIKHQVDEDEFQRIRAGK